MKQGDKVGVTTILMHAATKRNDGFKYTLSGGDLCTMGEHASFLIDQGFKIGFVDIYPALETRGEFERAIRLIYEHRLPGWQCYRKDLIEIGALKEDPS